MARKQLKRNLKRGKLGLERLENRIVLAGDFGAITGSVVVDTNANGRVDNGEGVSGATVELYRDANGNNTFDAALDRLVESTTSDANGDYTFQNLDTDRYFLVQPQQTVGTRQLAEQVSSIKSVSGNGATGNPIDPFTTVSGPTVDSYPAGTPSKEAHRGTDILGGQRDFESNLVIGTQGDTVAMRTETGRLLVNPDLNAIGTYKVTWDGVDSASNGLNPTGLGGVDLTEVDGRSGQGRGMQLTDVVFDQAGAIIRLRVYSNGTDYSEAVITNIDPLESHDFFIPFSGTVDGVGFTSAGGSGADFASVGAVELEVQATKIAMDGQLSQIGVIGSDPQVSNFINVAPKPSIDIEKFTNGNQADLPTDADVPVINAANTDQVTWTYVVTNNGKSALRDVQVTDDKLGAVAASRVISKSQDNDNILDVGESWTYVMTSKLQPGSGTYGCTGTVTGTSVDTGEIVSDADTSHYRGIQPAIDIEKFTNGNQADQLSHTDVPEIESGETVTWTYVVTNTGTDDLTDIRVTDDKIGSISQVVNKGDGDSILSPGEWWRYQATGVAIEGNYENSGTVFGTATDGKSVSDVDLSHYKGVKGGIHVEKRINGVDADTGTGPEVDAGDKLNFTYIVTNTGTTPLRNIDLVDDAGTLNNSSDDFFATYVSGDIDGDKMLDVDETWEFMSMATAEGEGLYRCTARVTGETAAGKQVSDDDPTHHFVLEPEVDDQGSPDPDPDPTPQMTPTISKRRFLASSL